MVNGPHEIWIERHGLISLTPFRFSDESHLRRIITKMVGQIGRRIDESSPMVDARLPDGIARERDHRAALALGAAADDPQVRPESVRRSTSWSRIDTLSQPAGRLPRPAACRPT